MSRKSMMDFAESMLSCSTFLQKHCRELDEFRDPEHPLPLSMLGHFGQQIAIHYETMCPDEWDTISAMIEDGLASSDDDVGTAVATGLVEGLIHVGEERPGLWPIIEANLGGAAREYADAYRNWGEK